jgi:type VI secretion system protein ImpG
MPQLAAALLETLYPQLMVPTPSATIAHFQADSIQANLTTGYTVPQHTNLVAYAEEGVSCRFTTIYDVTLWPVVITQASLINPSFYEFTGGEAKTPRFLRLKIACPTLPLQELAIPSLTFFIHADRALAFLLYELLFAQNHPQVAISSDGEKARFLPAGALTEVGFQPHHMLLPSPDHGHPAYQFIQEYFHFPEKFLFFSLEHLNFKECGQEADLLISLDPRLGIETLDLAPDNFPLGCTPVVNLFSKVTDPIRLDHRKSSYRLVPDQRRERTTEIHSIIKVVGAQDSEAKERLYSPYFSFDHGAVQDDQQAFWLNRREPTHRPGVPGSDVYLSFVDFGFNPAIPADETIFAHTWCTNRFLATQIPAGGKLQSDGAFPVSEITCLYRPIEPLYAPQDGETLWKLIAQLSVDHLSLASGSNAAMALKESLLLFAGNISQHTLDREAIVSLRSEPAVCRIGTEGWRGFVKGVRVHLEMDEKLQSGSSAFLLGRVLQHYFSLTMSINSFAELVLHSKQRTEVWKQWQPQAGEQRLL